EGLGFDHIGSLRHHSAISIHPVNPDGAWRPILACSNMPQPSAPLHLACATWSTTLYGSIPVTSGEVMSYDTDSLQLPPIHRPCDKAVYPTYHEPMLVRISISLSL